MRWMAGTSRTGEEGELDHHLLTRVGETEYVEVDPQYVRPSHFGDFYAHPDFPDRYDANQLCRVRCEPDEVPSMLEELEDLYRPTGLDFRKVSGYDPDVWSHLGPTLEDRGWRSWTTRLLVQKAESVRVPNPEVRVVSVPSDSPDLEAFYRDEDGLERGFVLARSQSARMGGEHLIGYVDGEPAGCTGWFVRDGIARFRHVLTAPVFRGQGVATTLIRHVQDHPAVAACDALAIMVGEDGPGPLYEQLGFRDVMLFWEAKSDGAGA